MHSWQAMDARHRMMMQRVGPFRRATRAGSDPPALGCPLGYGGRAEAMDYFAAQNR